MTRKRIMTQSPFIKGVRRRNDKNILHDRCLLTSHSPELSNSVSPTAERWSILGQSVRRCAVITANAFKVVSCRGIIGIDRKDLQEKIPGAFHVLSEDAHFSMKIVSGDRITAAFYFLKTAAFSNKGLNPYSTVSIRVIMSLLFNASMQF